MLEKQKLARDIRVVRSAIWADLLLKSRSATLAMHCKCV